ncbi:MAG: NUDIX hydrolase [Acidimicrobiales bacterium]|jgi:ADP-ribose pyrophosphatase
MAAPPDPLAWQLVGKRPGSTGWITVTTSTYRMPDGSQADWDLVEGPDIVAVLALTADGEVVLVRQFRPGPDAVLAELPGGIIDAGETPLDAGQRELLEETGYAGEAAVIGWLWRSASELRRQWVVVVTGARRVAEPDPGALEFLQVTTASLEDLRAHLRSGQLTDTAAGYRALDHLGRL